MSRTRRIDRIRTLLRRRGRSDVPRVPQDELDRELQFHVEMETEENLRRGLSPEDARRQALLLFGGVERFKEECRDTRPLRLFEDFVQDVRFGLRMLAKSPGYACVTVLTLALGIGANTAIFSLVDGVLLSPLPYANGERLVRLKQTAPQIEREDLPFSVAEIRDFSTRGESLVAAAEYHSMRFILLGHGEPKRVNSGVVSVDYFDIFGVRPILGRGLVAADDKPGAEAVLLLDHDFWRTEFGEDPAVVGTTVEMNDRVHTIVGVLPKLPPYPDRNDVWMPTSACPFRSRPDFIETRDARMMRMYGRLAPGASIERLRAEVGHLAGVLQAEHPEAYPEGMEYGATAVPLTRELTEHARATFLTLLGTVTLVLLIACANVASLMLSRVMRREHELAVRSAMGAGRGRLVRQLLTESTLLALIGGGLGLLIAGSSLDLLVDFARRFTPRAEEVQIDGGVLLFTLAISLVTGIVFGLIPALPARPDPARALRESSDRVLFGRTGTRLRNALTVAQVAISFTLLIVAGLTGRSLLKLIQVDTGFQAERVLTMHIDLNWSRYTDEDRILRFFDPLMENVRSLPGVHSVAMVSAIPLDGSLPSRQVRIEGRESDRSELPLIDFRLAGPGYFGTMGIPVIAGRDFAESDHADALPVAVINQSMARHLWRGEDPIGRRISLGERNWLTVVGVVGDVRQEGLDHEVADELYMPFRQRPNRGIRLLVRSGLPPMALARSVIDEVYALDPDQPVGQIKTLEQVRSDSTASPRLTTALIGLFAGLALLITATGVGAVIALSISQRTHEIGLRMALGAGRGTVVGLVLRQGMTLVGIGLVLGLVAALAIASAFSYLYFQIDPTDPPTFIATSVLVVLVGALACLVPAHRAVTIDPMSALRSD